VSPRTSENVLTVLFRETVFMLTKAALRALKQQGKAYKVADRDGTYVHVMPSGAISICPP